MEQLRCYVEQLNCTISPKDVNYRRFILAHIQKYPQEHRHVVFADSVSASNGLIRCKQCRSILAHSSGVISHSPTFIYLEPFEWMLDAFHEAFSTRSTRDLRCSGSVRRKCGTKVGSIDPHSDSSSSPVVLIVSKVDRLL